MNLVIDMKDIFQYEDGIFTFDVTLPLKYYHQSSSGKHVKLLNCTQQHFRTGSIKAPFY